MRAPGQCPGRPAPPIADGGHAEHARLQDVEGAVPARAAGLVLPVLRPVGHEPVGVVHVEGEAQVPRAGLREVAEEALEVAARGPLEDDDELVALDEAEQVQLLTQMEAGGSAANASAEELLHSKVFGRLKELTVVGYYFTEVGAKQERRYVPMPGRYDGYYKLNKVGRQWSS